MEQNTLNEVTRDGYVCWEYVNQHFAPYPEEETRKILPGELNALFRAFGYSADEIAVMLSGLGNGTNGVDR